MFIKNNSRSLIDFKSPLKALVAMHRLPPGVGVGVVKI